MRRLGHADLYGILYALMRFQAVLPFNPMEQSAVVKEQHRNRVGQPMLLALFIDAANPIEPRLNRAQDRRKKRTLAIEDARHVAAERLNQCDDNRAKQQNLNPANDSHGRVLS